LLKSDLFFAACMLTSNSHLQPPAHNKPNWFIDGDPADGAPITLATRAGASPELLNRNFIELLRIEPNNFNQLTTSLRRSNEDQSLFLFTKGAPEEILKYSSEILEDGFVHRLTKSDKKKLIKQAEQLAKNHTSLVALAYRNFPSDAAPAQENIEKIEGSLTWLGLIALDDQQMQIQNALKQLAAQGSKLIFSGKKNFYNAELSTITKTPEPTPITSRELADLSDAQLNRKLVKQFIILEPGRRADADRVLRLLTEAGHQVVVIARDHDTKNKDKPWLQTGNISLLQENVVLQNFVPTQIARLLQINIRLKKTYQTIHDMTQTVLNLSFGLTLIILTSFFLNIIFDIPILMSIPQILVFGILIELPILLPLKYDTNPSTITKTSATKDIFHKLSIKDTTKKGLLIAAVAVIGYFWFFVHNLISGIDLSSNSTIHFQATTLVFVILIFCLLATTLKQRMTNKLISRTQLQNRQFWKGLTQAGIIILLIVYVPFIGESLGFGSLGLVDWLSALLLAAVFVLTSALLQHVQKHSRIELIKKHSYSKIKHHLSKLKYQV
jgi:Ca2+-transporting ATPase